MTLCQSKKLACCDSSRYRIFYLFISDLVKVHPSGALNSSISPPRRTHLCCSINWDINLQRKIYLAHLVANSNIKALKRDHLYLQRNWSIKAQRRRVPAPCCSPNSSTRTQTGHMTREEGHVTEGIHPPCSTCFCVPIPQRHLTTVSIWFYDPGVDLGFRMWSEEWGRSTDPQMNFFLHSMEFVKTWSPWRKCPSFDPPLISCSEADSVPSQRGRQLTILSKFQKTSIWSRNMWSADWASPRSATDPLVDVFVTFLVGSLWFVITNRGWWCTCISEWQITCLRMSHHGDSWDKF